MRKSSFLIPIVSFHKSWRIVNLAGTWLRCNTPTRLRQVTMQSRSQWDDPHCIWICISMPWEWCWGVAVSSVTGVNVAVHSQQIFILSQSSVDTRAFNFPRPQFTTSLITEFATPLVCMWKARPCSGLPYLGVPHSVTIILLNYCVDRNRCKYHYTFNVKVGLWDTVWVIVWFA